jgi:hypothetical protein
MLRPFGQIVRCQDVDHAEIVDQVHRLIRLVRGPQATFVLVEEEMTTIG